MQTWRLMRDVGPRPARLPILPVPLKSVSAIRVFDADGAPHLLDPDGVRDRQGSRSGGADAFDRGATRAPGRLSRPAIEIDVTAGYGDELG